MSRFDAKILIYKFQQGQCSPEEQAVVEHWLTYGEYNGLDLTAAELEEDLQELRQRLKLEPVGAGTPDGTDNDKSGAGKVRKLRVAVWAAAAVATIVFGVWLFKYEIASEATQPRNDVAVNDVKPGIYGATITLANGQVIQLDSAKKGVIVGGAAGIAYSDNTPVISNEESNLLDSKDKRSLGTRDDGTRDDGTRHDGSAHSVMLTATTAKGQTYSFTLPDGSKVWLNADSKLEFPAQFSGKERKILMQGEAYFVVKHNDKQPFRVVNKTPDGKAQLVEDIGTEFNINAYTNESSVKTTLVEGAARVIPINLVRHSDDRRNLLNGKGKGSLAALEMTGKSNDGNDALGITGKNGVSVTLTPNQQAKFSDGKLTVKSVDAMAAVAWKDGLFVYNATPLDEVMRQIARWYNVEVSYERESLKKVPMGGAVSRYEDVSRILKTLENTGAVKFKLEGRTITVSE